MKTLTWADFAEHKPCYNPAKKYGQWEGTILDLMHHPDIPAKDKIWAFTREGIADDKTLRLFAVACARRVQHLMTDKRSINALDVAERYANGEATEDELAAARDAAWAAARDSVWSAASDAAWGAAWSAARDAAWAAAGDAEKQAQVEIAIELLTKLQ